MPLTKFVDRVPQQPNRKKIKFETNSIDLENGNYATVEYADNPTTLGTPLSADNLNTLVDAINDINDMTQPLLFNGAIKTGNITLTDSLFNYKFLIIQMASNDTGIPFGTAMMPIQQIPPQSQTIVFANTTETQSHSTYMGRCTYSIGNPNTINITIAVNNVIHTSGKTPGGGSTYFVRQIYGVK